MTDAAGLGRRDDLLALVDRDTRLRRVAGTKGGEWAGPCPFCGGRDRFRVQPLADPPRWWCRRCSSDERWQDAIAYVMRRERLGFVEARAFLGAGVPPIASRITSDPPRFVETEPSAGWRAAAERFVEHCQAALWSETGSGARAYLRGRGLSDETIRRWRLGWNRADLRRPRERWGLPPNEGRRIWLPRGVVIPWYVGSCLWHVKIRRLEDGANPRYMAAAGGHPLLFGVNTLAGHAVAVLVEAELDAILVDQEVGDRVGVAAIGSASPGLGARAIGHLLPVGRVLVAYDTDEAGERAAERMRALSARMRRLKVPFGKDPTEFRRQGGRIRDWIAVAVARHTEPATWAGAVPSSSVGRMAACALRPEPPRGVCSKCGAPSAEGLLWTCVSCADRICVGRSQASEGNPGGAARRDEGHAPEAS